MYTNDSKWCSVHHLSIATNVNYNQNSILCIIRQNFNFRNTIKALSPNAEGVSYESARSPSSLPARHSPQSPVLVLVFLGYGLSGTCWFNTPWSRIYFYDTVFFVWRLLWTLLCELLKYSRSSFCTFSLVVTLRDGYILLYHSPDIVPNINWRSPVDPNSSWP